MAKVSREGAAVNARIVYWGIEGAGKTENLMCAHARLRPDHRGELARMPSRLDPSVQYEVLPIALGAVGGVSTQIEMVAVPGSAEQAPMRKQLLDQVDGVVLVVDGTAPVDANMASLEELRQALAAYGRRLDDVPLVLQYNKRDLADPYVLEDLHRKLDARDTPFFEATASEGNGVMETLSTVSKRVIRHLRQQPPPAPAPAAPAAEPPLEVAEPTLRAADRLEDALAAEGDELDAAGLDAAAANAQALLESALPDFAGDLSASAGPRIGPDMTIVSVGDATRTGPRSVRVPLVMGDGEGATATLVLTVQLDPLLESDSG